MLTENEGSSKPHQKSSETMYVLSSKERVERERERERERVVLCKINRERESDWIR